VGRGDQHQIVRPTLRDSYRTEDNAHKPHIHFLPLPICVLLLSAKIIIDREDRASLGVPLSLIPAIGGQGREGSSFLRCRWPVMCVAVLLEDNRQKHMLILCQSISSQLGMCRIGPSHRAPTSK
jgi:hypothetical protein